MLAKAVTYSQQENSFDAGKDCVQRLQKQLGNSIPDFFFLFATIGHDFEQLLAGVRAIAPNTPLCGCSGAGSITNLGCDESLHSVALMGLCSDRITFHPFIFPHLADHPKQVGEKIGQFVESCNISPTDNQLLFLFPDGFTMFADALYKGIQSKLDRPLDFVGGTAGNDYSDEITYQFCNETILNDAVSGVLLSGQFHYHIQVSHGSKPLGILKTVTRSQGNTIYEIDQKPALDQLRDMFGEDRFDRYTHDLSLIGLNLIGLGVPFAEKGYSEDILIRAILKTDPSEKSLTVGTQMPEGSVFRMTRRDKNQVLEATTQMVDDVLDQLKDPDQSVYFYFNCVGRGEHLFGDPEPDVNELLETLDCDRSLIGFFTFGEIAPVMNEQQFHNYTGVFVGIETE